MRLLFAFFALAVSASAMLFVLAGMVQHPLDRAALLWLAWFATFLTLGGLLRAALFVFVGWCFGIGNRIAHRGDRS